MRPADPPADDAPAPLRAHPGPAPGDVGLAPATRLLWRSSDTVHLELGGRAVVVEGLPHPAVEAMTGHGPTPGRLTGARDPDVPAPDGSTAAVLQQLLDTGFLWPRADTSQSSTDQRRSGPGPRLAAELAGLAIRRGDAAPAMLDRRRRVWVVLHGNPRLTVPLAALLAAAGVGHVSCTAHGAVRLRHVGPGGLLPDDEGADLAAAASRAVARAAPGADTTHARGDEPADLVVLGLDAPIDPDVRAGLHSTGQPHLVVTLGTDRGTVGPLVVPGRSSCTRCADLHRQDRDPVWPALAAQLTVPRRHEPGTDAVTASLLVALAGRQVLAYLDGDPVATVDGTLETDPVDWRVRRRSWSAHPHCDCRLVSPVAVPHRDPAVPTVAGWAE